jgi:RNA polymerase sigma-70 factor (ECF subfamily)
MKGAAEVTQRSAGSSELVEATLAGDRAASRRLAEELLPVVQAVVARCLIRCCIPSRANAHQEVKDLVQQVFVALFENDARALRQWEPARGRSLRSFVGLIAEREVYSVLRSRARSPFTEEPTDWDADGEPPPGRERPGPEATAITREFIAALLERVRQRLGARGVHLFYLVVVEERPADEIVAITGITEEALYAWRSRFRKLARALAQEGVSDPGEPPRKERT